MMQPTMSCKAAAGPDGSNAGAMAGADILLWAADFYVQVFCSGLGS